MTKADPATLKKCQDLLLVAKFVASSSWPYLASAVTRMRERWTDDVPTMGVDKYLRLYLNPNYVVRLKAPTLALLIAGHEVQHVLGDHSDRLTAYRTDEVGGNSFANVCHDLAINSGLQSFIDSANEFRRRSGDIPLAFTMPTDGVFPSMFKDENGKPVPVGAISEEYAELLKYLRTPQCGKARGHSCGSGGGDAKQPWEEGDPDPADPETGATSVEVEVIRSQVAQAAVDQESEQRGTVPGGLRRWAESRLAPVKTPWPQLLRRAVKSGLSWARGRKEWSWAQLSRSAPPNILLPHPVDPEPSFVVLIDTSGSMGPADYDPLFRHVYAIMRAVGFRKVPVIACDSAASDVQYVTRIQDIKMVGGGGTDMGVGIAAAAALRKKMVIVFTDCCTTWSSEPRGMRVIIGATRPAPKNYPTPEWATVVACYD